MSSWLQNPWFIGIGGGIISGIIVAYITKYIFGKRENKEYKQKIEIANNEIIYSIRPSIAEKVFPSADIINSILVSTSKKYGVNKNDLYTLNGICNDLIKEIMENSFLSSQQKVEFCELISNFRIQANEPKNEKVIQHEIVEYKKENSSELTSLTMGVMTTLTVITIMMIQNSKDKSFFSLSHSELNFPILLIGTFIPIISLLFTLFLRKKRNSLNSNTTISTKKTVDQKDILNEKSEKSSI